MPNAMSDQHYITQRTVFCILNENSEQQHVLIFKTLEKCFHLINQIIIQLSGVL